LSFDEPPVFILPLKTCPSRPGFFAHHDIGRIFLKNSEVYEISLISDEYDLYFRDKSL